MHNSLLGSESSPVARAAIPTDAAQFMPFAALTGYYDVVREQERVREPRHTMTEERTEQISRMLSRLGKGSEVRVTYYARDSYETCVGTVRQIDAAFRTLELTQGGSRSSRRILFEDIWEIDWLG